MTITRKVRRVSPGPAQVELFGPVEPEAQVETGDEPPRLTFVDPSPEALSVGPQSLWAYLEGTKQTDVFKVRELIRGVDYAPFVERYSTKGRTPYHPAVMVGLILFGVARGLRSLRQLEALARENVCAWWLTGGACPDHASIGRFVSVFGDLVAGHVFEQLTATILQKTGTSGVDLAGDGTTIEAVASRFKLLELEAAELEAAKLRAEAARLDPERSAQERDRLERKAASYEKAAEHTQREKKRVSRKSTKRSVKVARNDPEATHQRLKNGFPAPSYKPVVMANDARIVVSHDVQSSSENDAIDGLCTQAKRVNGEGRIDTLRLDAGFFSGNVLETLVRHDVDNPLVKEQSQNAERRQSSEPRCFAKARFDYDSESDSYTCPAGQQLRLVKHRKVRQTKIYGGAPCETCPLRDQCTKSKKGRQIYRYEEHEELRAAMRQVMEHPLARAEYARRSTMVEPVFADLRQVNRLNRFLRTSLAKVRIEFGIAVTAHNLARYLAHLRPRPTDAFAALLRALRRLQAHVGLEHPWRTWAVAA